MDGIKAVCAQQWRLTLRDSGTLAFYACGALLIGGLLPLWQAAGPFVLNAMVLYPLFLLKQWASETFAAEKETRTLESLLATSVRKKQLILGKGAFCLEASGGCFCLSLMPLLILKAAAGVLPDVTGLMLLAVTGFFILGALCLTLTGLYTSAVSADVQEAGGRGLCFLIPVGFYLIVLLTLVSQEQTEAALLLGGVFLLMAALLSSWALRRLCRLERAGFLSATAWRAMAGYTRQRDTRIQSLVVLSHEWRYFRALGRFKFSLLIFTLAPAVFMVLWHYFFGAGSVYAALAVLSLGTARITVNLTAYTIGGERAYKTFESLLSTPVTTGALFLGKGLLALLFAFAISVLASLLMLLVSAMTRGLAGLMLFSPDQWLLLAAGLLFSLLMAYVTGLFSMMMKKPRQGLYVSAVFSFLAVVPALLAGTLTGSPVLWAAGSLFFLMAADLLLAGFIHRRISRDRLMGRI
ncbi:hypothetical protein [Eubacterium sp. 1001713B170207_170306_E7]|uniref:hypothetical protein n=1 Tax=Eubacterium sp. 1001713B170207_170306_E7 TaxID=2787097 RepID=UPI00189768C6|nr:hypothetical protein [Eubacterium sp. 1001713B170207_170306_E7]